MVRNPILAQLVSFCPLALLVAPVAAVARGSAVLISVALWWLLLAGGQAPGAWRSSLLPPAL